MSLIRIGGINIIVNPYLSEFTPKIKLRPRVPVSDAFRAEFDAWLLAMFGRQRVVLFLTAEQSYVMHPNTAAMLRNLP